MQGFVPAPLGRFALAAFAAALILAAAAPAAGAAPVANPAQAGPYVESPPPYLTPFPIVRIAGRVTRTGARILLVRVKAPRRARVTLVCDGGRRRGCPYRSRSFTAGSRTLDIRSMRRTLRDRARLRLYVRRGQTIGKYTAFRVRARRLPLRADRCVFPGSNRVRVCP